MTDSEQEQLKQPAHAIVPSCMAMSKTSAQDLKTSFATEISVQRSLNLCSIKLKLSSMKKSEIASLICQNTDKFFFYEIFLYPNMYILGLMFSQRGSLCFFWRNKVNWGRVRHEAFIFL